MLRSQPTASCVQGTETQSLRMGGWRLQRSEAHQRHGIEIIVIDKDFMNEATISLNVIGALMENNIATIQIASSIGMEGCGLFLWKSKAQKKSSKPMNIKDGWGQNLIFNGINAAQIHAPSCGRQTSAKTPSPIGITICDVMEVWSGQSHCISVPKRYWMICLIDAVQRWHGLVNSWLTIWTAWDISRQIIVK